MPQPERLCGHFVNHLYGFNKGGVPIFAVAATLDELVLGVQRDGLFIQPQVINNTRNSLTCACKHLRDLGVFPSEEQIEDIYKLTPENMQALGMTADDFEPVVYVTPKPPFKNFEMGKVLSMLKVAAKYFEQYQEVVLGQAQQTSYQLGVITLLYGSNGRPAYEAQLYNSQPGKQPTGTLWLHRRCVTDAYGGYSEQWYPLGEGTFDVSMIPAAAESGPLAPVIPALSGKKRPRTAVEADRGVQSTLPAPQAPRKRPARPYPVPDQSADHLFWDDPKSIRGETLYRLAHFYSNTELFERINAGLRAKALPEVKLVNNICQNIKNAIASIARRRGGGDEMKAELRASMHAARLANDVHRRQNARTQALKEANRMARA